MKLHNLKHSKPFEVTQGTFDKIIAYLGGNNYPETVKDIVNASVTGKKCVSVYAKFIAGNGYEFGDNQINRFGDTLNDLISKISMDYAMFGGFAVHINTNANLEVTETQHIPFDYIRLHSSDRNSVWLFDDWNHLNRYHLNEAMVKPMLFPLFNSTESQNNFSEIGFIYYYSNRGRYTYPLPTYSAALTDMNTEEGISNVLNRNARNNFFPAGFLINYLNSTQSEEQSNQVRDSLSMFQGDEKALNLGYIECLSHETKPDFISLKGDNYDNEFQQTSKQVKQNIGECFNQPPILRGEDVGSNFGADAIHNAYNYYNTVTTPERKQLSRSLSFIFSNEIEVKPLEYITV